MRRMKKRLNPARLHYSRDSNNHYMKSELNFLKLKNVGKVCVSPCRHSSTVWKALMVEYTGTTTISVCHNHKWLFIDITEIKNLKKIYMVESTFKNITD